MKKFEKKGLTFSGKVIYYNYKVREREKKEDKKMLVVYMCEVGGTIDLWCEVETEEQGWAIANEMNKKQDGFIYWVEEK